MNSDQIYDQLQLVAKASGHAKRKLLTEEMKPYLLAAYDPFTMYYNTRSPIGQYNTVFRDYTWQLLKHLSDRTLSGQAAIVDINEHVSGLSEKSAKLFNMILNKDLRIGMRAKSINAVFPGLIPEHNVMLAKLFDPAKAKFPCYGGAKIDGIRGTYIHDRKGIFTRKGHRINGLDHLIEQLSPFGIDVDGELIVPGLSFQKSSGLLRSGNVCPSACFIMFELPKEKDSFVERLKAIREIADHSVNLMGLKHYLLKDLNHAKKFYTWCRSKGYEGAVIRPPDYEYAGTRSWSWMKMKNIMDFDLKVIDMLEGKGKYKGMMGKLVVDYSTGPQKVGGGFSDQQREIWWKHPEQILGKTIEVVVTEFTDDNNFRHARMGKGGIRWDK